MGCLALVLSFLIHFRQRTVLIGKVFIRQEEPGLVRDVFLGDLVSFQRRSDLSEDDITHELLDNDPGEDLRHVGVHVHALELADLLLRERDDYGF